ncbi:MAG: 30S ribosomal protein S9 [bacterium]
MGNSEKTYATGRRKCSSARIWLSAGTGKVTVNKQKGADYFNRESNLALVNQPLQLVNEEEKIAFDVIATVAGGGKTGQAGAIRHGISKALVEIDRENRAVLKKAGLLTRDSRIKERKKPGQKGARARFQFSKR